MMKILWLIARSSLVGMVLGVSLMPVAAYAQADQRQQANPAAVVGKFYDGLLDVMKQGHALGAAGRYRRLAPMIDETFNLPLMTQVAIGPHWHSLSPEQQSKLIQAFRQFTIASYASNFDDYNGERFDVTPTAQPMAGGSMVLTRLVPRDKKPIALNYVMRDTDGRWQVVDVYAQGTISELASRRSEFTSVLSRNGVDALTEKLVEKAETLLNAPA